MRQLVSKEIHLIAGGHGGTPVSDDFNYWAHIALIVLAVGGFCIAFCGTCVSLNICLRAG